MAKTLKCNISFALSAVVNTETVNAVEVARLEARKVLTEGCDAKGEQLAFLNLFASEKTTEELLEILLRKGIREVTRKELVTELNTAETSVKIGEIKVAFEAPVVPREIPLHAEVL